MLSIKVVFYFCLVLNICTKRQNGIRAKHSKKQRMKKKLYKKFKFSFIAFHLISSPTISYKKAPTKRLRQKGSKKGLIKWQTAVTWANFHEMKEISLHNCALQSLKICWLSPFANRYSPSSYISVMLFFLKDVQLAIRLYSSFIMEHRTSIIDH